MLRQTTGWECLSYCLMENHYHLLMRTPEPTLREGMQRLNGSYAHGFNARHGLVGHVFGGRYTSVAVTDDSHLRELIRYILVEPSQSRCVPASRGLVLVELLGARRSHDGAGLPRV